jgi:two-component system response regulator PilR (NtrC family)
MKGDSQSEGQTEIRLPSPDFSRGKIKLDEILGQVERIYLLAALQQVGGVKKKAADLLGITLRSMRYRLNKLGIPFSDSD